VREALAIANSDLRSAPRPRASSGSAKSSTSNRWQKGPGTKPGRQRLALVAGAIFAAAIVGILANALLMQKTRHPAPILGRPLAQGQKPVPAQVVVRPTRPDVRPPAVTPDPQEKASQERSNQETAAAEPGATQKPRQSGPAAMANKPSDPIGELLKVAPRETKAASAPERRPEAQIEQRPVPALPRPPAKIQPPAQVKVAAETKTNSAKLARPPAATAPRSATVTPANRANAAARQPSHKVAAAQRALVKLGFVLEANGVAGETTRKAIERYERDRGLPARGTLSPDLVRRLGDESGIAIE
jgi:hypothetical protein